MCAGCHNTRLLKNYDEATDSYHTTMDEISVSCGSCHASLVEHVAWQAGHKGSKDKDPTYSTPSPARIVDNCGACHSRRDDITGDFVPGDSFFDHFQLQILDDGDPGMRTARFTAKITNMSLFLAVKCVTGA